VCSLVPNGKFTAIAGISNGNPLCGGTGSQLANPHHTLTTFADFTTNGSSYIDMRLPFVRISTLRTPASATALSTVKCTLILRRALPFRSNVLYRVSRTELRLLVVTSA
jgi:hypothetical protein